MLSADPEAARARRTALQCLHDARRAAGFRQEDDSGKGFLQLCEEVHDIARRQRLWHEYVDWFESHRWTWRWRTYPGTLPPEPKPLHDYCDHVKVRRSAQ